MFLLRGNQICRWSRDNPEGFILNTGGCLLIRVLLIITLNIMHIRLYFIFIVKDLGQNPDYRKALFRSFSIESEGA